MNGADVAAECYRRMYDGMIAKDRSILDDVLDDDFSLLHMTGMHQDKETFIRAVEDGTLNYYTADHKHIEATIDGDTARVDGRSIVTAAVFGGGRHTWRLRLQLDLSRNGEGWKVNAAQASTW